MLTINPVVIDRATPDDVWGMQDVFYLGWRSTYPNKDHGITVRSIDERFKDRHSPERLEERRKGLANPSNWRTTFVARREGRVIGVCRVARHPDTNELEAIYLLPECQRRGIGTMLWQEAKHCLDASQPTRVLFAVYNEMAKRFYWRLGFRRMGERVTELRFRFPNGTVIPEMEMWRDPGPAL